ncbi:MAG: alpha/beta family hydrolase [Actinomycetota bacterium]
MPTPEQRIQIETERGGVTGALAVPRGATAMLVIAHGAGGTLDAPFLVGLTRAMNTERIATLRFNFLYSEAGRRAPDPELRLREAWRGAFAVARKRAKERPVFVGGKSLGGRIASMCVADGELDATGLVFLGYPLHPPGKPEKIRDAHLYDVKAPMLFLQGTSDPFAKPDRLRPVIAKLKKRATLVPIEGGDHSFRVKGAKRDDREIGASLAPDTVAFIRKVGG